jgi:hypothetical protein
MLKIKHRINTVEELRRVPETLGIECDVRSQGAHLIAQHDPFKPGDRLSALLSHFRHAFLILNIKSEGLEEGALVLLKQHRIRNYFFLDLSFPSLMRLVRRGEKNIAVRFSEHEPVEQALALKGKARWVWMDYFGRIPLDRRSYVWLKADFRICAVSPELQGHSPEDVAPFKKGLSRYPIDAVCTKYPELW